MIFYIPAKNFGATPYRELQLLFHLAVIFLKSFPKTSGGPKNIRRTYSIENGHR